MLLFIKKGLFKSIITMIMTILVSLGLPMTEVGTPNDPVEPPVYVQQETEKETETEVTEPSVEIVTPSTPEETEKEEDVKVEETQPTEPVHTHDYKTTKTEPTCTKEGFTSYDCVCGETYDDNFVSALGHDYKTEVIAPTTEAQGYSVYTCKRCGDSFKDNYTDKLPKYTKVEETVYVTGAASLNVRKGPGTGYDRVGSLDERASVTRVGIGDNGWSQIIYNGELAYASSNYLTTKKPADPMNLNNYNSIKHNYNGLTSEDRELINTVLDYCEQYRKGEVSEPVKVITVEEHTTSMERVNAYFIMEFASNPAKNALYRLGIVNSSCEPTKYIITIDATDYANILAKKNRMDAEIDRILKTFRPGTEEELLRQCADYLRNNLSYQSGASVGADAIFTGKANCDSFAQVFMKMAMRLGIQCDWCHGIADGGGHAWNRVTFSDGRVRYYDVCWYDGSGNTGYLNRKDTIHELHGVNTTGK